MLSCLDPKSALPREVNCNLRVGCLGIRARVGGSKSASAKGNIVVG
jgi:hypothetical protein